MKFTVYWVCVLSIKDNSDKFRPIWTGLDKFWSLFDCKVHSAECSVSSNQVWTSLITILLSEVHSLFLCLQKYLDNSYLVSVCHYSFFFWEHFCLLHGFSENLTGRRTANCEINSLFIKFSCWSTSKDMFWKQIRKLRFAVHFCS